MVGFLDRAQTWLAGVRTQSLATELTIEYERPDVLAATAIDGVVSAAASEIVSDDTNIYVDVQLRDFIIPTTELTALALGEPEAGDRIHVTDAGGTVHTYEVVAFGGTPAWEPHDQHWSAYRVHASAVKVV